MIAHLVGREPGLRTLGRVRAVRLAPARSIRVLSDINLDNNTCIYGVNFLLHPRMQEIRGDCPSGDGREPGLHTPGLARAVRLAPARREPQLIHGPLSRSPCVSSTRRGELRAGAGLASSPVRSPALPAALRVGGCVKAVE